MNELRDNALGYLNKSIFSIDVYKLVNILDDINIITSYPILNIGIILMFQRYLG